MTIFWIVTAIGIVVFGAMAYSIYHHRQSKGAKAAHFHESTTVELLWTAIPIVILIVMAIPATKVLIDLENTDNAEMTLKITGHQWKWQYDYIENDTFGVPKEGITMMSNLAQSSRGREKLGLEVVLRAERYRTREPPSELHRRETASLPIDFEALHRAPHRGRQAVSGPVGW